MYIVAKQQGSKLCTRVTKLQHHHPAKCGSKHIRGTNRSRFVRTIIRWILLQRRTDANTPIRLRQSQNCIANGTHAPSEVDEYTSTLKWIYDIMLFLIGYTSQSEIFVRYYMLRYIRIRWLKLFSKLTTAPRHWMQYALFVKYIWHATQWRNEIATPKKTKCTQYANVANDAMRWKKAHNTLVVWCTVEWAQTSNRSDCNQSFTRLAMVLKMCMGMRHNRSHFCRCR